MHHFLISKSEHSHPGASPASPLELQMTEILDCSTTSAKCLPQQGEQQLLALGWPSKASEGRPQPGVSSSASEGPGASRQKLQLLDYSHCPDYGFQRAGAQLGLWWQTYGPRSTGGM